MHPIFKHIITVVGAVLLALAFVPTMRNNGVVFDPIDMDDLAVMRQSTGEQSLNLQKNATREEMASDVQNKHSKKVRLKHTSFQFVLNIHENSYLPIVSTNSQHGALKPKRYTHFFYRDMKPPPRLA